MERIKFAQSRKDFVSTLNKRVNEYFKNNNIARHGNSQMVIKTAFMFLLYFTPYTLILTNAVTSIAGLIGMVVVMALGLAGIGLSVMHDANHGAYTKNNKLNNFIGYSLNLVGANAFNWKMQHNVLHHTYTNVHEEDEDISPRGALRLTPHSDWKKMHKYQFIYAWFLYGLMTIVWLFYKDFSRLYKYQKNGMAKAHKANVVREWVILLATKIFYFGYIFILPLVLTSLPWWHILIGIVVMHYIAGFIQEPLKTTGRCINS
jgi:linoleoyl-CoA desaturase